MTTPDGIPLAIVARNFDLSRFLTQRNHELSLLMPLARHMRSAPNLASSDWPAQGHSDSPHDRVLPFRVPLFTLKRQLERPISPMMLGDGGMLLPLSRHEAYPPSMVQGKADQPRANTFPGGEGAQRPALMIGDRIHTNASVSTVLNGRRFAAIRVIAGYRGARCQMLRERSGEGV